MNDVIKVKIRLTVTKELPKVISDMFGSRLTGKCSITGHSMGGHGALICAMKNPGMYASASVLGVKTKNAEYGYEYGLFSEYGLTYKILNNFGTLVNQN